MGMESQQHYSEIELGYQQKWELLWDLSMKNKRFHQENIGFMRFDHKKQEFDEENQGFNWDILDVCQDLMGKLLIFVGWFQIIDGQTATRSA